MRRLLPMTETFDSSAPASESENASDSLAPEFFPVGICASAGGLDAISELLKSTPTTARVAFLVVQHLDPAHESILVELLRRVSQMPVDWAVGDETLESGRVYVAPPKSRLALRAGKIVLTEQEAHRGGAIDHMFRSLAEDAKDRAIGVILSGTGSDGDRPPLREPPDQRHRIFSRRRVLRVPAPADPAHDPRAARRGRAGADLGARLRDR